MTMKNQFANDIIQKMLPYIDNAQADKLRQALFLVMEHYEIAESRSKATSEPTNQDLVNGFLSASDVYKRQVPRNPWCTTEKQ